MGLLSQRSFFLLLLRFLREVLPCPLRGRVKIWLNFRMVIHSSDELCDLECILVQEVMPSSLRAGVSTITSALASVTGRHGASE